MTSKIDIQSIRDGDTVHVALKVAEAAGPSTTDCLVLITPCSGGTKFICPVKLVVGHVPLPRPIIAGDTVTRFGTAEGPYKVIHIFGERAWVQSLRPGSNFEAIADVSKLTHYTP